MNLSIDQHIQSLLQLAMKEDVGDGDVSASLLHEPDRPATFDVLFRQPAVVAGLAVVPAIAELYDSRISVTGRDGVQDGSELRDLPEAVATIAGPVGAILTMERVLLNFLQRLSGVATTTRAFVNQVSHTNARILDTRKTIPGWRELDKYAVRCGGGDNHRQGLFDAVMIKDNHFSSDDPARMAAETFNMLNTLLSGEKRPKFVEVEADRLDQLEALLSVVGIDIILLDNFGTDQLRSAVEMRDDFGLKGKVMLEASGGVTLQTVRDIADTGVERISVGALTHSAPAVDISLERTS
ncbi:MAG: carboxylating nicotinate-nucleotide diphosphorylase [Planctomycetota bacterium]